MQYIIIVALLCMPLHDQLHREEEIRTLYAALNTISQTIKTTLDAAINHCRHPAHIDILTDVHRIRVMHKRACKELFARPKKPNIRHHAKLLNDYCCHLLICIMEIDRSARMANSDPDILQAIQNTRNQLAIHKVSIRYLTAD